MKMILFLALQKFYPYIFDLPVELKNNNFTDTSGKKSVLTMPAYLFALCIDPGWR